MGFSYDYVPVEELSTSRNIVLAEGPGAFKIIQAVEGVSKGSSRPQLTLTMILKDQHGQKNEEYKEYFTQGHDKDTAKILASKLYNLFNSIGKPELYGPGKPISPYALIGCTGKCEISTEPAKDKYAARSRIRSYVSAVVTVPVSNFVQPQVAPKPVAYMPTPESEDIPF